MTVKDHKNYFGRTMRFADNNGNIYDEAFFVISVSLDSPSKTIEIKATFYKSITEFEEGLPPIPESDGGLKRGVYRGEAFDKYVQSRPQLIGAVATEVHASFDAILDTPKAGGGFESFFEGASEIILPG